MVYGKIIDVNQVELRCCWSSSTQVLWISSENRNMLRTIRGFYFSAFTINSETRFEELKVLSWQCIGELNANNKVCVITKNILGRSKIHGGNISHQITQIMLVFLERFSDVVCKLERKLISLELDNDFPCKNLVACESLILQAGMQMIFFVKTFTGFMLRTDIVNS